MAYRQPSSSICLLKGCPCDSEYNNTIWYETRQKQYNGTDVGNLGLLSLCIHKWYNKQSYQRKGKNSIRLYAPFAEQNDFLEYNYLIFSNCDIDLNDYSTVDKSTGLFYCFIDTIEYINDNTLEITYSIDVMQTYMFDYQLGDCYIEREHSSTDNLYEHLEEESFGVSDFNYDYITQKTVTSWCVHIRYVANKDAIIRWYFQDTGNTNIIVFINNHDIASQFTQQNAFIRNKTFTGYFTVTFPLISSQSANLTNVQNVIKKLDEEGGTSTICSISILPSEFNVHSTGQAIGKDGQMHFSYFESDYPDEDTFTYPTNLATYIDVANITTFHDSLSNSYTPKNKKLYNYPYNQLFVTNNIGDTVEIAWENITRTNNTAQFWLVGVLFNLPEMRLIPLGCNGISINIDNSLSLRDFPSCSWSYDSSKAQWEQHKSSIILNLISSAILGLSGLSAGGTVTSISAGQLATALSKAGLENTYTKNFTSYLRNQDASLPIPAKETPPSISMSGKYGLMSTAKQVGSLIDMRNMPSQQRGKDSNTQIIPLLSSVGFKFYAKTIKPYEAQKIDEYFSLYGYVVKKVKTPNIFTAGGTHRPYWYYIKNAYTKVDPHFRVTPQPLIDGYVNEEVDSQLKAIYNKGITFWFNSSHVGNYTLDNTPT